MKLLIRDLLMSKNLEIKKSEVGKSYNTFCRNLQIFV